MSKKIQEVCFVVMGFGKKTDYESGRTLDLDATFEAIIKPAVRNNKLRCIRADELMHSGIIDTPMYEMLLRAELVIADISTGNVNAVYELGVRHALRPNSTIIMKEDLGKLYFDIDHVKMFEYEHMGADIGHREANRAQRDLSMLISEVMKARTPDSPVYTYLPKLQKPHLSEAEYAELLDEAESAQQRLSEYMRAGNDAMESSQFGEAVRAFEAVLAIKPDDPFVTQQLALATYKNNEPSALEALIRAREIISRLTPEQSNDPETLGIHGAIRKRLWELTRDLVQLNAAIGSYGRGFEVRRDYYNGENYALCLDLRAALQTDPSEANYDRMSARKIRESVYDIVKAIILSDSFPERSDRRWVLATAANMAFSLGYADQANQHESAFMGGTPPPAEWEIETYQNGKATTLAALAREAEPRKRIKRRNPTRGGSKTSS